MSDPIVLRLAIGAVILPLLIWLLVKTTRTQATYNRHLELAELQYAAQQEGLKLVRENTKLQAEANELMRELISALRDAR